MRPLFSAFLHLSILFLSACAPNAPQIVSQELNLYSFSEYIPADLISGFEKETRVRVNLETYATNEELLANLTTNPQRYDVIVPSDYAVDILIKQDALLPLDFSRIENYTNIDPPFLTPYFDAGGASSGGRRPVFRSAKYTLPYQWGTTGFAFDQTKIGFTPTTWNDLWRPELKGHLVVLDDAREMMGVALLALGYDRNDTDQSHLQQARDKLVELAPSFIRVDAQTPETALINGDAWAGVVYNGNAVLAARENPNISFLYPQEGGSIWFDNLAVPKGAPHPDAAHAFINYVLKPEAGWLLTRDFPYGNPNRAAIDYLEKANRQLYDDYVSSYANPAPSSLTELELIKNVPTAIAGLYEQYWQQAKEAALK